MRSFFYVLYYQILQLHTINILQVQSISVSEYTHNPTRLLLFFNFCLRLEKRTIHGLFVLDFASCSWCLWNGLKVLMWAKIWKIFVDYKESIRWIESHKVLFLVLEHYAFRCLDGVKQMYAFYYYSTFVLSLPFLVLFR